MKNYQGLLGNPMFTAGMSLLGASRDKRNDPYAAVLSGMQMSNQYNNQQQLLSQRAAKNKAQQQAHEQKQAEYKKQQELETKKNQYLASLQDNPNINQDLLGAVQAGVMGGDKLFTQDKQRQMYKGADGYNYWQDSPTERVNPNIESTAVNKAPGYGLTPMFATDENGNISPYQLSNQGGAKPVVLPEGVSVLGPGGIAQQKAEGAARGKYTGEQLATASSDIAKSEEFRKILDKAKNHPGREAATGFSSILNPMALPGSERKDFLVVADQLRGKNFMEAYQGLKGGGQITEVEGKKAEEAQSRLNEAQSESEYLKAIDEMDMLIAERIDRIRAEARSNAPDDFPEKYRKYMR